MSDPSEWYNERHERIRQRMKQEHKPSSPQRCRRPLRVSHRAEIDDPLVAMLYSASSGKEKEMKTVAEGFLALVTLILMPVTFLVDAFVTRELWKWYVVPTFHLQPLTLPLAFGLGCIGFALVGQTSRLKQEYREEPIKGLLNSIGTRLMVLGLGALGTLWL